MAKIQRRDMRQQTMQKRIMQKGRTMVEMLGVLAVIGVLSIGGITGMRYAMQIYKENETLNAFSVATAGARTANLMQTYIYSCDNHYPCVVDPEQVISTKYEMTKEDFTTAVSAPVQVRIESTKGYTVRIRGISKELCESIKSGFWGETCAGVDRIGSNNTYRNGDCKALKSLDCAQFDNAATGLLRRSLLQQDIENKDSQFISYKDTVNKYSALVLYYGEEAGSVEYVPGNPGSEDEKVPGQEENKDPDNKDPENPGGKDPDDKDPENPGGEDPDNPPSSIPTDEVNQCRDKGGHWVGTVCCNGAMDVLRNAVNSVCCNNDKPRYGADDGTCCGLMEGYEWKNSVCCKGVENMEGTVVAECCTGEYEWKDGVCCSGVNNVGEGGSPDAKCCDDDSEFRNNTCCKGLIDQATGKENLEACAQCDNFGNDKVSETATEYCCRKDFGNQGGKWIAASGEIGGVCCKEGTSADLSSHGAPAKECCKAIDGEWKHGVCCKGVINTDTTQADPKCCNDGAKLVNNEICCNGIIDQNGSKNPACCEGSVQTPGASCEDEDADYCCKYALGGASGCSQTGEIICCKPGTSIDLTANNTRTQECCEFAGYNWKGTFCCKDWGKKNVQGMCRKP